MDSRWVLPFTFDTLVTSVEEILRTHGIELQVRRSDFQGSPRLVEFQILRARGDRLATARVKKISDIRSELMLVPPSIAAIRFDWLGEEYQWHSYLEALTKQKWIDAASTSGHLSSYITGIYQTLMRRFVHMLKDAAHPKTLAQILEEMFGNPLLDCPAANTREAGPTLNIEQRFKVFQRLKNQHPTWTQERVAREAFEDLNQVLDAQAVRNAYRAMGAQWPKADRVRSKR